MGYDYTIIQYIRVTLKHEINDQKVTIRFTYHETGGYIHIYCDSDDDTAPDQYEKALNAELNNMKDPVVLIENGQFRNEFLREKYEKKILKEINHPYYSYGGFGDTRSNISDNERIQFMEDRILTTEDIELAIKFEVRERR
jgi:hypothetical protein